jgi:hypothetical protein
LGGQQLGRWSPREGKTDCCSLQDVLIVDGGKDNARKEEEKKKKVNMST